MVGWGGKGQAYRVLAVEPAEYREAALLHLRDATRRLGRVHPQLSQAVVDNLLPTPFSEKQGIDGVPPRIKEHS